MMADEFFDEWNEKNNNNKESVCNWDAIKMRFYFAASSFISQTALISKSESDLCDWNDTTAPSTYLITFIWLAMWMAQMVVIISHIAVTKLNETREREKKTNNTKRVFVCSKWFLARLPIETWSQHRHTVDSTRLRFNAIKNLLENCFAHLISMAKPSEMPKPSSPYAILYIFHIERCVKLSAFENWMLVCDFPLLIAQV